MGKTHTPNPEYIADGTARERLDDAMKRAIARSPKLAFSYTKATLQLQLAKQLAVARAETNLSQAEFAKKAGLSQPFIARLENPYSAKQPSLETLSKLAHAFGKHLTITFDD